MNGSKIAKDGFRNELDIIKKFNNWQSDSDAQQWLSILDGNAANTVSVNAQKVRHPEGEVKPDIQVVIQTNSGESVHNISIKLVKNKSGSNQVDKRWVDTYSAMWNIPPDIVSYLKEFTGETKPAKAGRSSKRTYLNERSSAELLAVINFFKMHKRAIVTDILQGRRPFAAQWLMVAQKTTANSRWIIQPMTFAIDYFCTGSVIVTSRGGLRIGSVRVQRKGGDRGQPTANKLQFKLDPSDLFDI